MNYDRWRSRFIPKREEKRAYVEDFSKSDTVVGAKCGSWGLYVKVGLKTVDKNADRVSCW
jgi:hypothetical protein